VATLNRGRVDYILFVGWNL